MYVFASDETNKNPEPGQFFIYGGIVLDPRQVGPLNTRISEIRAKYGYLPGDSFKFNHAQRPAYISPENARLAKEEVIRTLEGLDVRMIVYVLLHDIAVNQTDRTRLERALNVVALRYHDLLRLEKSEGVMLIDRTDEQHSHLAHLFQHGTGSSTWTIPLADRIVAFGMTSDNASNIGSAADIALGAFRYCVNTAVGQGRETVAQQMFPPIARMIWGVQRSGVRVVDGYGYNRYPLDVRVPAYRGKYDALAAALARFSGGDHHDERRRIA